MNVALRDESEIKKLLEELPPFFVVSERDYPLVCTFEVTPKKRRDGACEVSINPKALGSGDRRFKEFAEANKELYIILMMQRFMRENPSLTDAHAREKATAQWQRVVA
jgi:hypothetical protein